MRRTPVGPRDGALTAVHRRLCAVIQCVGAIGLAVSTALAGAATGPPVPMTVSAGKQIYQNGLAPPASATLGRAPPCSACHGWTGRGQLEGGVQIPPISAEALEAPGRNSRGDRPSYDEASLRRAVTDGTGSSGLPLNEAMPRQPLTDDQWSNLYRYLLMLGSSADHDPGVGEKTLRVGTVLSLTGPSASIGARVRASMEATFAEVNARGGVFGRRLDLVVEDGGTDRQLQLAALRRVLYGNAPALDGQDAAGVFALVGAMLHPDDPEVAALLADGRVPLIGPLAHAPDAPVLGVTYYLLPSLLEQTTALLAHVLAGVETRSPPRLALLHDGSERSRSLTDLIASWLSTRSVEVVLRADISSARGRLGKLLSDDRVDACLYLGDIDPLIEHGSLFADSSNHAQRFPVAAHADWLGPRVNELPLSMVDRLVLVHVAADGGWITQRTGSENIAFAAARLFVEGARRSGRQIDREGFVGHLDRLRDFRVETWPPLTFSLPGRVGNHRMAILRFDRGIGAFVDDLPKRTP